MFNFIVINTSQTFFFLFVPLFYSPLIFYDLYILVFESFTFLSPFNRAVYLNIIYGPGYNTETTHCVTKY